MVTIWTALYLAALTPQASQAEVIGTAAVTSDEAPIYKGQEVVARAKKGDKLNVSAVKGEWYGVIPVGGWVHKKHVEYVAISARGEETPQAAIRAIMEHYRSREFDRLIRERYAEIGKAETEDKVAALVERFKKKFSGDERIKQAIAIYETALEIEPTMENDGNVAKFKLERGFVKLSKMKSGKWGFHL